MPSSTTIILCLPLLLSSHASTAMAQNLGFDINRLNADGLQGPDSGLRALHYEYCIPDSAEAIQAVTSIDPSLQIQGQSPGRVGCNENELLCLGNTHQPNYRDILEQLTRLPYIEQIQESFFE